jgi:hypothetical protein
VSTTLRTVHIRVNDAATGQPTPVRIRITDADGTYYAPFGRLVDFPTSPGEAVGGNVQLGDKKYAYIDGTCEVRLPPGRLHVEISKGPEYTPIDQEVTLGIGKIALRFQIERWIDMRQQGWYAGDTRTHFLSPPGALLEGAAEDLAVVNLLATDYQTQGALKLFSNIIEFSGQRPAAELPGHLVVVNTLNRHPVLGTLALLHCHRPVFPLSFGGQDGKEDWALADWCDQCHRKGGLVISALVHQGRVAPVDGEALADVILGKVDASEVPIGRLSAVDPVHWYPCIDAGWRVPLVGCSGKASNTVIVGEVRTYARLPAGQPFAYRNWIESIRAGRTFITSGPLLDFTIEGQEPGSRLVLTHDRPVAIHAVARSQAPFDRLELIADGNVVLHSARASGSPLSASIALASPVPAATWLAVRCWEKLSWGSEHIVAHSSPIYVEVERRSLPTRAIACQKLDGYLDETTKWLTGCGRFDNDQQRGHLLGIIEEAKKRLAMLGSGNDPALPRSG